MRHDDVEAVAQATALEVARRLKDDDLLQQAQRASVEQSSHAQVVRWRPHSLSQGSAGLAVLFEHVERCFPGQGWDTDARRHLEAAARSAEASRGLGISLFGQLGGVAFATWYLSRGGRRYRRLSAALDAALAPMTLAAAEQLDATTGGCRVDLFDLVSGITGAGVYLLGRSGQDAAARSTLERVLHSLVALSAEEDGLPRWWTPPHLFAREEQIDEFPDGHLNCGLAHGIPGPLSLMSLAASHGISVPGLKEGIERIVGWLLFHRADDEWGVSWPAFYPVPPRGEPRSAPAPRPCKNAWCYGSPGLSRALYLAGRAIARPAWCQTAIDAMQAAIARPVEERLIPSPTFCHGVAGLLQITARFALDTGLPVFERARRELLARLVSAFEPASILGFRSIDVDGGRVDDPGLLDGAPGVCLAMLAATARTAPTWDRFLLLS